MKAGAGGAGRPNNFGQGEHWSRLKIDQSGAKRGFRFWDCHESKLSRCKEFLSFLSSRPLKRRPRAPNKTHEAPQQMGGAGTTTTTIGGGGGARVSAPPIARISEARALVLFFGAEIDLRTQRGPEFWLPIPNGSVNFL